MCNSEENLFYFWMQQLTKKPKKDYFNDYSAPVIVASSAIATAAWDLLSWDFRMVW